MTMGCVVSLFSGRYLTFCSVVPPMVILCKGSFFGQSVHMKGQASNHVLPHGKLRTLRAPSRSDRPSAVGGGLGAERRGLSAAGGAQLDAAAQGRRLCRLRDEGHGASVARGVSRVWGVWGRLWEVWGVWGGVGCGGGGGAGVGNGRVTCD